MKAISVNNLTKEYKLGGAANHSIRDAVAGLFRRDGLIENSRSINALSDVSFTVNEGERLGIIGRNGAGKSTLLKILSRISKPSKGSAEIRGRVGCLLEVGTGFHNELTGRENIFLNGAILGMKRTEINRKFDEIVAFSEIEKFLDTPVKYYSSGMYMRLAFSVAAHLDPEVLIVDEVLAVGDAPFQRKCLSKMREVGESGRTVLFVSHDMSAVTRLCDRAIWLKDGRLELDGGARETVGEYLHDHSKTGSEREWNNQSEAPGNQAARLRRVQVCNEVGKSIATADIRRDVYIEMTYDVLENGRVLVPNIHIFNEFSVCIFISHDWEGGWRTRPREAGTYVSRMKIPGNFLAEGLIYVRTALSTYVPLEIHFDEPDVVTFNVVDPMQGNSARGDYVGALPGIVRPALEWETVLLK